MLQVCLQQSWPLNKPISQTVFPQIIPSSLGNLAAKWVMLPKREILHYIDSKPHKQFLFTESPYPMLLWITALHAPEHRTQWLSCYLDLKDSASLEITQCLAETGFYRLLLFCTEEPQRCAQVMTATFSPSQCQRLQEWMKCSQSVPSTAQPLESRRLLRIEFEKLKSQFVEKLEPSDRVLSLPL